jgi:tetratricopeptide (TPR) repeat protein
MVKTPKVGRNDPCPCGSGKKYKNCCLLISKSNTSSSNTASIDKEINDAGMLSLEHDVQAITKAIQKLQNLKNRPNLTEDQKLNIQLGLASAYQRRGEHMTALEVLESIDIEMHSSGDRTMTTYVKHLRAVSYNALGLYTESCSLFEEALNEPDQADIDPRLRAIVSIEAGKSYAAIRNKNRARECWEDALNFFQGRTEDIEHYTRVKANLGFLLLNDPEESKQEEGIKIIEEASHDKARIGDLEGLANNYCNLGLYYWGKKRYERAIAFIRKDLYISRKVGDSRAIATTLCNLAALYGDLKQLSSARKLLKEAQQIADTLKDSRLSATVENGSNRINEIGRQAGEKKERIGRSAICVCGSGKKYQDCCGRADFEPIDVPIQFDGISDDLVHIQEEITGIGKEPSRLDFIFRETEKSKRRLSWSRIEVHDGWVSMSELPDMANHYLATAKILADEASAERDSTTKPLACVILSVCALESFINQVAFFLSEIKDFYESKLYTIPAELEGDALEFQRRTELSAKWDVLGKALCGDHWPPNQSLMNDFRNMTYIRNELIHFKASDYEQVVPPPKIPNDIMRRVPESVEIRDVLRAWPFRILTPSFASWCVNIAQSMVDYFKQSYRQARLL